MRISKQARRDAKHLFLSCQANGLLSEDRARLAVSQLIARKPRYYQAILNHFKRLVQQDIARRTALQANLARRYGAGLEYVYSQNPGLVGGARIQIGSDVYDGSIRARLTAVQETF
jgi:F-type H+-transporting ATPase subunit delta